MTKTADQWLEVVKDAKRILKPENYQDWQFIVGSSGSLEERIELGEKVLEMLKPKSGEVVTFNFNRGIIAGKFITELNEVVPPKSDTPKGRVTNAVSPLSGDYPMQRGVKRS